MDYEKILILIGAILILASMFLAVTYPTEQERFIDLYGVVATWISNGLIGSEATVIVIGALIAVILHPITIALAFLSVVKIRLILLAGILGIVSCVGIIVSVSVLIANNPGLEYGVGIWVSLAGAIILLISPYMGKMIGESVSAKPSQPPFPSTQVPPQAFQPCPTCGRPLTFVQQYNRWYCYNCKKYL